MNRPELNAPECGAVGPEGARCRRANGHDDFGDYDHEGRSTVERARVVQWSTAPDPCASPAAFIESVKLLREALGARSDETLQAAASRLRRERLEARAALLMVIRTPLDDPLPRLVEAQQLAEETLHRSANPRRLA